MGNAKCCNAQFLPNECLENGVQSNFTTSIAKAFLRLTLFFGFLFFFFRILPTFQPLKFFFKFNFLKYKDFAVFGDVERDVCNKLR